MTQYEKLNFVNGSPPALNAATLNHIEDGIAAATEGVTVVEKTVKDNKTETNTALATKADKTEVDTALETKADKATTLAGYSITDGENTANKTDTVDVINASSKKYVSEQAIKNFYSKYVSNKLIDEDGSVDTYNIADKAVTADKLADDATNIIAAKADKATTLGGYGITDGIKYVTTNSIDDCTDDKTLYRVHISDGSVLTGYHNLICINQTYYKSQYLFAQNGKIQFRVSAKNSDGDWGDWSDWRVLNDGAVTTKAIADKAITIAKLSDDLLEYIKSSSGTGNGKSAYEIAVDNGFEGTETEWLASLKGYTPVKGTDYFTADDINTIVNAVYAKVADGTEVAY